MTLLKAAAELLASDAVVLVVEEQLEALLAVAVFEPWHLFEVI